MLRAEDRGRESYQEWAAGPHPAAFQAHTRGPPPISAGYGCKERRRLPSGALADRKYTLKFGPMRRTSATAWGRLRQFGLSGIDSRLFFSGCV